MKLTLVIDTEDLDGIKDTFKIIKHFYTKYVPDASHFGAQVTFGKIEYIKMLRKFARSASEAQHEGIDPASLRFTKTFADDIFVEKASTLR